LKKEIALKENAETEELIFFEKAIKAAFKIPGIRITRDDFLRKNLNKHCAPAIVEKAIETTPAIAGIDKTTISMIADNSIKHHLLLVTSLSFALSLPGKIGYLAGTLPADFAQILYHVIVLIQKLCYLYGWPDFFDSDELDDETIRLISPAASKLMCHKISLKFVVYFTVLLIYPQYHVLLY
jgi:hypothetical protein